MPGVSLSCSFTHRATPVISIVPLPSGSVKLVPGFSSTRSGSPLASLSCVSPAVSRE